MARTQTAVSLDLWQALVESYAVSGRMNQVVLEHLDPGAWRAKLPGSAGRTIAAIFSHVHNIRLKWLRLSAPCGPKRTHTFAVGGPIEAYPRKTGW